MLIIFFSFLLDIWSGLVSTYSLFLHAQCLIGLPKTDDFGAMGLFIAHPIAAVTNGINGRTLWRCTNSANKRHWTSCSVLWFKSDWWPAATKCLSSIWLPRIKKVLLSFSGFCVVFRSLGTGFDESCWALIFLSPPLVALMFKSLEWSTRLARIRLERSSIGSFGS